jgi:hypothetical protein
MTYSLTDPIFGWIDRYEPGIARDLLPHDLSRSDRISTVAEGDYSNRLAPSDLYEPVSNFDEINPSPGPVTYYAGATDETPVTTMVQETAGAPPHMKLLVPTVIAVLAFIVLSK